MSTTQEASCEGKIKYDTRWAAKSDSKRIRSVKLQTYLCEFCAYFHNGKPVGWRSTKRGKKYIDSHTVLFLPEDVRNETFQEVS